MERGPHLTASSTVTYGLANGGTGGLLVIYLLEFFGLLAVVMCLAEMSSM
jgi:amino acid permease